MIKPVQISPHPMRACPFPADVSEHLLLCVQRLWGSIYNSLTRPFPHYSFLNKGPSVNFRDYCYSKRSAKNFYLHSSDKRISSWHQILTVINKRLNSTEISRAWLWIFLFLSPLSFFQMSFNLKLVGNSLD